MKIYVIYYSYVTGVSFDGAYISKKDAEKKLASLDDDHEIAVLNVRPRKSKKRSPR